MLLLLHISISGVKTCLQCERTIRLMHEDFILSEPNVLKQIELQKISDYAFVTYRETSETRRGVIGEKEHIQQ